MGPPMEIRRSEAAVEGLSGFGGGPIKPARTSLAALVGPTPINSRLAFVQFRPVSRVDPGWVGRPDGRSLEVMRRQLAFHPRVEEDHDGIVAHCVSLDIALPGSVSSSADGVGPRGSSCSPGQAPTFRVLSPRPARALPVYGRLRRW